MEACCCVDNDFDPPRVWRTEIRKARKEHRCVECEQPIKPGEHHEYTAALDDSWADWRTCLFCVRVRRDFFRCGWTVGGMRQDFMDCHGWDYTASPDEIEEEVPNG